MKSTRPALSQCVVFVSQNPHAHREVLFDTRNVLLSGGAFPTVPFRKEFPRSVLVDFRGLNDLWLAHFWRVSCPLTWMTGLIDDGDSLVRAARVGVDEVVTVDGLRASGGYVPGRQFISGFPFRRRQSVLLLGQGFSCKEAGRVLGVSGPTVKSHSRLAVVEVGAAGVPNLLVKAKRWGLLGFVPDAATCERFDTWINVPDHVVEVVRGYARGVLVGSDAFRRGAVCLLARHLGVDGRESRLDPVLLNYVCRMGVDHPLFR